MLKNSKKRLQIPGIDIKELLHRHLQQEKEQEELEGRIEKLHEDSLQTNKMIFDYLMTVKGEEKELDGYLLKLERTKEIIPAKTTYKYKDILQTIEANYELDQRWLRRVYSRYATKKLKEIIKNVALLITKM